MIWLVLIIAGLFETAWAIGLKYTEGFSKLWPTFWTIVAMVISVWLLGVCVKHLPVGTAYAVWVGIGAVGTVIGGIYLFNEPVSALRIFSLCMIVAGIIGLKLAAH
jgi:quaternary ammonium compound-resistance protein SugE